MVHPVFALLAIFCTIVSNAASLPAQSPSILSVRQLLVKNDIPLIEKHVEEFEIFITKVKRIYRSDEETIKRYNIFSKNLELIEKFNIEDAGKTTYGVNDFADLSDEEWSSYQMPAKSPKISKKSSRRTENPTSYPDYVDWRNKDGNHVTHVKYQGPCGSCWAFSAVAATESSISINQGYLENLSNQQVLDCTPNSEKCKGGEPKDALDFIIANGGIASSSNYPYIFFNSKCRTNKPKAGIIKNYIAATTEEEMKDLVAFQGPIIVGANFATNKNRFYRGGIADDPNCGTNTTHALVVIGYGPDYWLLKNSYSTLWGENGFMRVRRGVNWCGIMTDEALLPV